MDYVTIKVYRETRRMLRLIAAASGEQMVEVLDRLCSTEAQHLGLPSGSERPTEHRPDDTSVIPRLDAEPE